MRRIIVRAAVVVAVCSVGVTVGEASDGDHKVLLCHATNSGADSYELISVDMHGAEGHLNAGHGDSDHTDFLLPAGRSDCTGGPGGGE